MTKISCSRYFVYGHGVTKFLPFEFYLLTYNLALALINTHIVNQPYRSTENSNKGMWMRCRRKGC